jgi:hypothetical protein
VNKTLIRNGAVGAAVAAFVLTLSTIAPAAAHDGQTQSKRRVSPAASNAIKNKANPGFANKLLAKRRLKPSP